MGTMEIDTDTTDFSEDGESLTDASSLPDDSDDASNIENEIVTSDDEIFNGETNEANSWNDLPISLNIIKISKLDKVYPNFPHLYNEPLNKRECLLDFIAVANDTLKNKRFVEPRIILYCLRKFLNSQIHIESAENYGNAIARALGCFLHSYIVWYDKTEPDSVNNYAMLPVCILKQEWYKIFSAVRLDDFLEYVMPAISRVKIPNRCKGVKFEYKSRSIVKRTNDNLVFFSLIMRFVIFNFQNITREIRSIFIGYFEEFVGYGNYLLAVPFSFFAPTCLVRKLIFRKSNVLLSKINRISRRFITGFKKLDNSSSYLTFKESVPNFRYLDFKIYSLISSYRFHHCKNIPNDTINCLKNIGFAPFEVIPVIKLTEGSIASIYASALSDPRLYDYERNLSKEFFSLPKVVYNYFARTILPYASNDAIYEKTHTERNNVASECVVCLHAVTNTIFLTCLHNVCCANCSSKLKECPICRDVIVARINDENDNLYDRLQMCVLQETFSMFEKLINKEI